MAEETEPDLQEKLNQDRARRFKRGRPRKNVRHEDVDPDNNGGGTAVAVDPDTGIAMVDEAEIEEIKKQMSPSDKLLAPIEDYRNLSAVTGRPIIWLVKNAVDPYKCTVTIERRAPAFYRGKKVKTGVLRAYGCGWPFDLDTIKARLESEQGGEEYVFIVKHDAKPLRALNVNIDEPPKFDPELTIGDQDITGIEPLDEIEKERIREERMTRLLQTKRSRIRAAKEVKDEERDAAPAPEMSAAEIAAMQAGQEPGGYSEEEVERMIQEREERLALRQEIKEYRSESDRRFDALLNELRNNRPNDGGGSSAMIQAMQLSMGQMMEGLKMVVANVGEQLRATSESSKEQFSNVLKMIEINQTNSRALYEAQAESRRRETELLLEAAGAKQEMAMLTADRQMDLMKQGMEFARQLAPSDGDAEMGWANKVGNMLTQLIAGKMATGAMSPSTQLPSPEQAAASQPGQPMSQEHIDTAARRIADRVMAKVKQERVNPAQAPLPSTPDMAEFVRSAWLKLHAELDTRPAQSEFTKMVIAGPMPFMAGIGKAEKIQEIISMVSPYVPADQIGAVGAKLLDVKAQEWTLNQVTSIKAAYAKRLATPKPAAPAPASAPAPKPAKRTKKVATPAPAPATPPAPGATTQEGADAHA